MRASAGDHLFVPMFGASRHEGLKGVKLDKRLFVIFDGNKLQALDDEFGRFRDLARRSL